MKSGLNQRDCRLYRLPESLIIQGYAVLYHHLDREKMGDHVTAVVPVMLVWLFWRLPIKFPPSPRIPARRIEKMRADHHRRLSDRAPRSDGAGHDLRGVFVRDGEGPVRARALGVHPALRDDLAVEVASFSISQRSCSSAGPRGPAVRMFKLSVTGVPVAYIRF